MSSSHVWVFQLVMLVILFFDLELQAESSKELLQHSTCGDNCHLTRVKTRPQQAFSSQRKLLVRGSCTERDISISQSKDSTSGIPQYIVQIVNTCISGCPPSEIHLHCGWFASARIVIPRTFKRVFYDDCLVNGGKALKTNQAIRFTYTNSFMYPLSLKSAKFC